MADHSWIYAYAAALGKSVSQVGPADLHVQCGDALRIECTIRTSQEAEAVHEIIRILGKDLSSFRVAVRGDIYPPEPQPSFRERLEAALGSPATAEQKDAVIALQSKGIEG